MIEEVPSGTSDGGKLALTGATTSILVVAIESVPLLLSVTIVPLDKAMTALRSIPNTPPLPLGSAPAMDGERCAERVSGNDDTVSVCALSMDVCCGSDSVV